MNPPVLLLIDYQKGFDEIAVRVRRNNLEAEGRGLTLIEFWREKRWPIIHVRHDSTRSDSPFRPGVFGNQAMNFAAEQPGEPVVRKIVNNGFVGTDLADRLRALDAPQIVVAGASTDHCVTTTVRGGSDLGFPMTLAADACFTFDRPLPGGAVIPAETIHEAHIASLDGEFARIASAAEIVAEFSSDADTITTP
ncbi:cysteine hydrolase family protein [Leptospira interrogans]